jgi:hypothetical protein
LVIPDSTRIARFSKSTLRMRFMRERPMTMASSAGKAPPDSDVPAPRGTTFKPVSRQYLRTFATSSVEPSTSMISSASTSVG